MSLMSYRRTVGGLMAVALVAAVSIGVRAEIVEQILVKVNGEIFTKTDLEVRQVAALRQRGQQLDAKAAASDQALRKLLNEITPQVVVDAVDEMLLTQRGRELGYKLSDDQFKSVVDNIRKENKIETEEQFQQALRQENMTMADLRKSLEKQMLITRVQQNEVFGKIGIAEDEARAYYSSHLNEFTTQPTVTLREFLVALPADTRGINAAADDDAKAKAEGYRARIAKGESFETLAGQFSEAPSKANAGLIGPISRGELASTMQALLGSLKPGEMSPVVRSQRGYTFLKLETSTSETVMPFEQAREQIGDRVFSSKRRDEFNKYVKRLRGQAIIEWKNDDIKKAYEAGLEKVDAAPPVSH